MRSNMSCSPDGNDAAQNTATAMEESEELEEGVLFHVRTDPKNPASMTVITIAAADVSLASANLESAYANPNFDHRYPPYFVSPSAAPRKRNNNASARISRPATHKGNKRSRTTAASRISSGVNAQSDSAGNAAASEGSSTAGRHRHDEQHYQGMCLLCVNVLMFPLACANMTVHRSLPSREGLLSLPCARLTFAESPENRWG